MIRYFILSLFLFYPLLWTISCFKIIKEIKSVRLDTFKDQLIWNKEMMAQYPETCDIKWHTDQIKKLDEWIKEECA